MTLTTICYQQFKENTPYYDRFLHGRVVLPNLWTWIINYKKHYASLETDSWSAGQRDSSYFIEHKGSSPCSQNHEIYHYPTPDKAITRRPILRV